MREIWEGAQGVAVDWMFSFRIKFVGLESILGDISVVAGVGLFLTFWRSLGGSLGEQVVFMTACFQQTWRKVVKMLDNVNIQSHGTKNIDIACFRKVL